MTFCVCYELYHFLSNKAVGGHCRPYKSQRGSHHADSCMIIAQIWPTCSFGWVPRVLGFQFPCLPTYGMYKRYKRLMTRRPLTRFEIGPHFVNDYHSEQVLKRWICQNGRYTANRGKVRWLYYDVLQQTSKESRRYY
jgi:hypothetical protein